MKHRAFLTVGLGYGDEGKGRIVDELCRVHRSAIVVRHSGGPQCAHNVVLEDGRHHCFAQIGSGAFTGAKTYYSRFALFDPYALLNEADVLKPKLGRDPLKDFYLEEGTPVITPFHSMTNRMRETARSMAWRRHGSCGMGIGELRQDIEDRQPVITAADLFRYREQVVHEKLTAIRELKAEQLRAAGIDPSPLFAESLYWIGVDFSATASRVSIVKNGTLRSMIDGPVVFENAQGVMLDQLYGFEPHRSWTDVTFGGAMRLLEGLDVETTKIGILRSYATRHGAGPFPSERAFGHHPELHNETHPWQGDFRQGYFDRVAASYALDAVGGVDGLAITHMDRGDNGAAITMVDEYRHAGWGLRRFIDRSVSTEELLKCSYSPERLLRIPYQELPDHLGAPIMMTSAAPFYSPKVSACA